MRHPVPDYPSWLGRIPHLLEILEAESAPPWLGRTGIEQLFGVRRRRAIALLHRCQGYRRGRHLVAARDAVVAYLLQRRNDAAAERAQAQQQEVAAVLGQARLALTLPRIALPPSKKWSEITFAGLPAGIHLTPGRLIVEFETATGLLEKLLALAHAFANDFDSLEAALAAASEKEAADAAG
jgi:hypothetical protein